MYVYIYVSTHEDVFQRNFLPRISTAEEAMKMNPPTKATMKAPY